MWLALIAACDTTTSATRPTPVPRPSEAAEANTPKRVNLPGGAAADVTVTGLTMGAAHGSQYAVMHVEIVGRSTVPFAYNEDHFASEGTDLGDPWKSERKRIKGPDPTAVFPPALRSGTLQQGQRVSGNVPFLVGIGSTNLSAGSRLLVHEYAPDLTTSEAMWNLPITTSSG